MGTSQNFISQLFPFTGDRARARLSYAVAFLLFAYPATLLSVRSGTSTCFTVLVILAFYFLLVLSPSRPERLAERTALLFGAAMASLVVATAVNEIVRAKFALGPFDGPSRFLFAFPVFLLLREMRAEIVAAPQCVAVLLAAAMGREPAQPAHV